jgi:hypothetical protein
VLATRATISRLQAFSSGPASVELLVLCKDAILASGAVCQPGSQSPTTTPTSPATPGTTNRGAGGQPGAAISEGAAEAILAVFHKTRKVANQPLGVIVNYDVSLEGYVGQRVVVQWSLWSRHGGSMTERQELWLRNRPVQTLIGEAVSDKASPEFWIPLPIDAGPFQVEVSAYSVSGDRLAYQFSQPFS